MQCVVGRALHVCFLALGSGLDVARSCQGCMIFWLNYPGFYLLVAYMLAHILGKTVTDSSEVRQEVGLARWQRTAYEISKEFVLYGFPYRQTILLVMTRCGIL